MKTYAVYMVSDARGDDIYVGCTSVPLAERLSNLKSSFHDHSAPFTIRLIARFTDPKAASDFEQAEYKRCRPFYNAKTRTAKYPCGEGDRLTFMLRFPGALRKKLHVEAKARKWSLNTYLLHLVATHQERVKA